MKRIKSSYRHWRAHIIFILSTAEVAKLTWTRTVLVDIQQIIFSIAQCAGEMWPLERPDGMPSIQSLEVMCGKDHMDVHLSFSNPFEGIVSSKGQHGDPRCVYVPPSTGQTFFSFRIAYARCGTKPDLHGQFYENTVVVQYDKDLLEVWDEAKRLRCEWFNDYEKTASKPPMVIADLDVIQLDFRGDNVDCWMEIQHGKGPWAPPVSGIVPLGSTLTLVVAINDYRGEFDMRVKSCAASDGGGHVIHLSDEFGCVLRPKMISRFLKARASDERASVITYAFFHAFKFPDALSVHIKCKVEICRHGCLDHCQQAGGEISPDKPHLGPYAGAQERKDHISPIPQQSSPAKQQPRPPPPVTEVEENSAESDLLYDDIIQHGDEVASFGEAFPSMINMKKPTAQAQHRPPSGMSPPEHYDPLKEHLDIHPRPIMEHMSQDRFPHGPRNLDPEAPLVMGPRSFGDDSTEDTPEALKELLKASPRSMPNSEPIIGTSAANETPEQPKRRRRNVVVSDRKARSADVGVSGIYEVISEADLAFSPDNRAEAVTVFQGRIREEVVYGICLPVPGFSALFVLVAVSAVVSALVAGSLLYRYQMQREHLKQAAQQVAASHNSSLSNWMALRLLKVRHPVDTTVPTPTTSSTNTTAPKKSSHEG